MFRKVCVWLVSVTMLCVFAHGATARAAEQVTGRTDNWFSLTGATRLSVDFKIGGSQKGYHYYSLSPFFDGQNYGLYSGIQTTRDGPLYIFSVWNATKAYPQNGAYSVRFGGEGVGYSLRKIYPWKLGTTYTVTLKRESLDPTAKAWRWSSTLTDKTTGASLKLGEIVAPKGANTMKTGAVFHERFTGHALDCGATPNLETTSMAATHLRSDKPVSFYGAPIRGGVFASAACKPLIHAANSPSAAFSGFGMSKGAFSALLLHPPALTRPRTVTPTTPVAKKPQPRRTLPATGNTGTVGDISAGERLPAVLAAQAVDDEQTASSGNVAGIIAVIVMLILLVGGAAIYIIRNPFVLRKIPKLATHLGLKTPPKDRPSSQKH